MRHQRQNNRHPTPSASPAFRVSNEALPRGPRRPSASDLLIEVATSFLVSERECEIPLSVGNRVSEAGNRQE